MSIWWNNDNQDEIGLPDLGNRIKGIFLRRPFLVLFIQSEARPRINVYKVETGASEGTLLKSMALDLARFGFWDDFFTSNQYLIAFPGVTEGPGLRIFIVRIDSLLDESKKTAEEVEINQISLPGADRELSVMCMNTTTLLFTTPPSNQATSDFVVNKKDFWVGQDHPQLSPFSVLSWLRFRVDGATSLSLPGRPEIERKPCQLESGLCRFTSFFAF